MKASRRTDTQKVSVFKQGEEGAAVAEVCRKAGIRRATPAFAWAIQAAKYAGLMLCEMRRLRVGRSSP